MPPAAMTNHTPIRRLFVARKTIQLLSRFRECCENPRRPRKSLLATCCLNNQAYNWWPKITQQFINQRPQYQRGKV